jgi:hypothetical protein
MMALERKKEQPKMQFNMNQTKVIAAQQRASLKTQTRAKES